MRNDSSIQFTLAPAVPRSKPPAWIEALVRLVGKLLEPIGHLIAWIASFFPNAAYARIALWTVIAASGAILIWALVNRIRYGQWKFIPLCRTAVGDLSSEAEREEWAPEEAGARSWLEEADVLAQGGRYAEAIHHLLFRSIEDVAKRRPRLVRPALTSRELAASEGLPARARELFANIAGVVEQSLFGGGLVDEREWITARQSYSDFVLPSAWRG